MQELCFQHKLTADQRTALLEDGLFVYYNAEIAKQLDLIRDEYDRAVRNAEQDDISIKASTRVHDIAHRSSCFEQTYLDETVIAAGWEALQQPIKLSSFLVRTLNPGAPDQGLHQDYGLDSFGTTMVGFILMIDDFTHENGATRFQVGSHLGRLPLLNCSEAVTELFTEYTATGKAGSFIIYNGAVFHGHGPNLTNQPRRSLQGSLIRRKDKAARQLGKRFNSEQARQLCPLATYLLELG